MDDNHIPETKTCIDRRTQYLFGQPTSNPTFCITSTTCNGVLMNQNFVPATGTVTEDGGSDCTMLFFCGGDELIGTFPGTVVNGSSYLGGSCYEITYCQASGSIANVCTPHGPSFYPMRLPIGSFNDGWIPSGTPVITYSCEQGDPYLVELLTGYNEAGEPLFVSGNNHGVICMKRFYCDGELVDEEEVETANCCLGYWDDSPCCIYPAPLDFVGLDNGNEVLNFSHAEKSNSSKNINISASDKEANLVKKIYPNPFSNILNIEVTPNQEIGLEIAIYDIFGKNILKKSINPIENTQSIINLEFGSNLPAGVYEIIDFICKIDFVS